MYTFVPWYSLSLSGFFFTRLYRLWLSSSASFSLFFSVFYIFSVLICSNIFECMRARCSVGRRGSLSCPKACPHILRRLRLNQKVLAYHKSQLNAKCCITSHLYIFNFIPQITRAYEMPTSRICKQKTLHVCPGRRLHVWEKTGPSKLFQRTKSRTSYSIWWCKLRLRLRFATNTPDISFSIHTHQFGGAKKVHTSSCLVATTNNVRTITPS